MKILSVDIFVLVRTWVPSMHATTVGNPASRRNFALCRSACCCVGSCFDGSGCGWLVDADDLSHQVLEINLYTCRVAGKGPCRVSGYSKSSRSSSMIVRISCRRNLNLSYNSTSSYISSGFFLSRNTRFRFKFLLCWLLQTITAAIFHHRLRVTPPS